MAGEVADVDAVERDAAAVELVEPHDEVDEGRLAGAGGSDDGHGLTGAHRQVEVLDERLVGRVGEGHALERHGTVRVLDAGRLDGVGLLLVGVEDLEHALGRGDARLEHVGHRGDLRQRLRELPGVLDERLDVTEAHGSGGHPEAADDGDEDVVEVPDEHHDRHDDAADELGPERGLVELAVLLLEGLLGLLLAAVDLDEAVPVKAPRRCR